MKKIIALAIALLIIMPIILAENISKNVKKGFISKNKENNIKENRIKHDYCHIISKSHFCMTWHHIPTNESHRYQRYFTCQGVEA